MEGAVSLDNSVGTKIHGDETIDLDCLVKAGSHNTSWDDLSIRDCMCWKKDHPLNTPSTALACSMQSSCIVGHISEACPCKEHTLQTFTCCTFPQAKEHTREVRSLTLFSRLKILTSFTRLLKKSPRVPNYFELAPIFEINWCAASGVLSTNAPPLAASMIMWLGISPS
jgi:hypothetical protein